MGTWTNNDGLYIKLGTTEGQVGHGGTVQSHGELQEVVIDFQASDLAAVASNTIFDNVLIPDNAVLQSADLFVHTAFVGATATLDLGLIDQDRSTEIDFDGIDAAIAVASLTAGATITCNGALIGTEITNTGIVTARNNTADFTAGRARLTIRYWKAS